MNEETKLSLDKFSKALQKLEEGIKHYHDELSQDGVIQRFEFTFELCWKTLKIFLGEEGVDARTPRQVFDEAFRLGWIEKGKIFIEMLKDRNETAHIYSKEMADEIVGRIKVNYVREFGRVLARLKKLK